MNLYDTISKAPTLGGKPSEEKQYQRNKPSDDAEFVVSEVVGKPVVQTTLTESTIRTNDLFMELLGNQLRNKL